MGFFNFFKKKQRKTEKPASGNPETVDRSAWTGSDFEFLITGNVNISNEDHDRIMTPRTLEWKRTTRNDWPYYQVGQDEFSYSWEEPGIQMTFNREMTFEKVKLIVDEVIQNIRDTGQESELIILNKKKIYRLS